MAISSVLDAREPHGKAETHKSQTAFNPPSLPLMGRYFPKVLTSAFVAFANLFSFTPRFTNAASPGLVIGDWDWS